MLNGIDISNWQANSSVMDGYAFVIMKATEGVGFKDKRMDAHASHAIFKNKLIGFYHFARPDTGNTAQAEADYFLSVVKAYIGKCVLALDLECSNWGNYVEWTKQWLTRVYEKTGVRPLLYMPGASAQKFKAAVAATNTGLWICSSDGYYAGMPIVMKQEVINNLDHDTFYGDENTWNKYANPSGSATKPASTTVTHVAPARKTNEELAAEVYRGVWGNDPERSARLRAAGYDPEAVRAIVNEKYYGIKKTAAVAPARKTNEELAAEVYRGVWGNDPERSARLRAAGYDPEAVRAIVNEKYYGIK
jgi:lysozyme